MTGQQPACGAVHDHRGCILPRNHHGPHRALTGKGSTMPIIWPNLPPAVEQLSLEGLG